MYQAVSPDCHRWVDGSNFGLPKEIDVFAGKPVSIGQHALDLDLSYSLPKGAEARFADQNFVLDLPHGDTVARGTIVKVERVLPAPNWSRESISTHLDILRGEDLDDDIAYQITIRFPQPIPNRFDFTPPSMIVEGKTYPVRTFTYRWFASRSVFGLCM